MITTEFKDKLLFLTFDGQTAVPLSVAHPEEQEERQQKVL